MKMDNFKEIFGSSIVAICVAILYLMPIIKSTPFTSIYYITMRDEIFKPFNIVFPFPTPVVIIMDYNQKFDLLV